MQVDLPTSVPLKPKTSEILRAKQFAKVLMNLVKFSIGYTSIQTQRPTSDVEPRYESTPSPNFLAKFGFDTAENEPLISS